jgi:uncharacterized DUF497 family protein
MAAFKGRAVSAVGVPLALDKTRVCTYNTRQRGQHDLYVERGEEDAQFKKHGLDFDRAKLVFNDPYHLSEQDRIEGHEYRWQTLGMVDSVLLIVGHNYEEAGDENVIRIITARKATPKERRLYHEAQEDN